MINLLIVDDEPAVRAGLRMRMAAEADLAVVGEAADAETSLRLAQTLRPDVVLLDVEMPDFDGIAAARAFRAVCPHIAVILLTMHDDAVTQARARAAGASAVIAKRGTTVTAPDGLLAAIRAASPSALRGAHLA